MSVQAAASTAAGQVYLCVDCGCGYATGAEWQVQAPVAQLSNPFSFSRSYIYDGRTAFSQLPKDYICPVCQAPKRR